MDMAEEARKCRFGSWVFTEVVDADVRELGYVPVEG